MRDRSTIKAGIFVVVAMAILVVATLWVAGLHFGGAKQEYDVLMGTAAGVREGDQVRVSGMEVGRVQAVELRPGEEWPVVFRVALREGIPLTQSASARLTSDGLLGAPYLEIDPGPPGEPLLPPDSTITGSHGTGASEAFAALGDLSVQASVTLDEMTVLLQSLSERTGPLLERFELLLSDENLDSLSASLAGMRDTMEASGPRLSALLTRLDELAQQLQSGVEGLPDLTGEIQGLVTDMRTALGPEGERLATVLDSAASGMSSMQMNRGELEAMVKDLRLATANLRAFTEAIKERPSLLVRKSRAPDRQPGEGVDK
jgi:phospholipid/cholesterol/gamma-HCH transport system substrate-binding protein